MEILQTLQLEGEGRSSAEWKAMVCQILYIIVNDKGRLQLTATPSLKCQCSHVFSGFCFVLSTESRQGNAIVFKHTINVRRKGGQKTLGVCANTKSYNNWSN